MKATFVLCSVLAIAPVVSGRTAKAGPPDATASTRVSRPTSVSFAASFMYPAPGLDVSYQVLDRFAVGAQLTSMILYSDLSLRTRYFWLAEPRWGLYLGANARLRQIALFETTNDPGADLELGFERREHSGLTVGIGAGYGLLRDTCCYDSSHPKTYAWNRTFNANIRIGKSF